MINKAVARRYAQALLALATEKNALDEYEKDLAFVVATISEQLELKNYMESPKVLSDEKKQTIKKLFTDKISPMALNFVCLVIDKQREQYLLDMLIQYRKYMDEAKNIMDAEVRSAVQLTNNDFEELVNKLSKATGKNIRLKQVIDTSLLGGLVVRIGDKVIDGSVAKRLTLLRQSLQDIQFN